MALARTLRLSQASAEAHGTGSFTTSAFTPSNSSLLVVVVGVLEQSGSTDPSGDITLTDSVGLTWTTRQTVGNASSWSRGVRVFTAPVTTGASMTLTADCGARNIYDYKVIAIDWTGYDTGTPTGATASNAAGPTNGALALTLSAAPASDSDVLAWLHTNPQDFTNGSHVTPNAAWTEITEVFSGYLGINLQAQARTGSTSTSVDWDDVSENAANLYFSIAGALEIKAAAAAAAQLQPWQLKGAMGAMVAS